MAPVYGNYHGYYTKRPSLSDPRLALVPPDVFRDKTVLDIGCNEGAVTCEIAHAWGARRVLGVDIDPTLVRLAWKHRRTLWSHLSPRPVHKRMRLDPAPDDDAHYFPASCAHTHGPLPIPSDHAIATPNVFPHNVAFRTADWATEDTAADAPVYDVVLAFSITKWIHLHHGDQGLAAFFRRAHGVLKPGGVLLVEPQPWESYTKARRMDSRLKENAKGLCLRPRDFPALLAQLGFSAPQHLGTTGQGGFYRPVDLYTKK